MSDDEQVSEPDGPAPFTKDPETRRLLYDELRHRHDVQREVSARLEGKAALVLGATLALVPFVAREPVHSWWLPVALAFYAAAGLSAIVIVLPRRFEELGPERVLIKTWWWNLSDAAGYLALGRVSAVKANVEHQAFKVRWLKRSIALLVLAAILSAVHLTQGERVERERSAGRAGAGVDTADACVDAGT